MLKNFVLLAVFALSIPAYADLACQSSFDSLKSAMGNCNFGDQSACDAVCAQLTPSAPTPASAGCSGAELDNARNQGRQQIITDLSVNSTLTDFAFGTNEADCKARVSLKLESLRSRVVDACNTNTQFIHNCQVIRDARITVASANLPRVTGNKSVSMNVDSSNEVTCRATALAEAKNDALNRCKAAVGFDCTLADDSTAIVRFKKDNPIIGKKKYKCSAEIAAIAPSSVTTQCTAEMKAQNIVGNGN